MIKDLQEGCVLSKDVMNKTNRPIMLQKTIITKELIDVLHAFLIKEVSVQKVMVNGKSFIPNEIIDYEEAEVAFNEVSFNATYLLAVQQFKRLFKGWQAGASLDVTEVRKVFIPLLEKALLFEKDIFSLHHYSTKEDYFYHHAISVGIISGYLAKKLNLNKGDVVQVALAGCLSDAGMAKIPTKILEKKTSLTFDEYTEVKKHPVYGSMMLQKSSSLKKDVKVAILQHHERLDGSGYPLGEVGSKLHIFSKIVAVADVYHAMTSERIYRIKQSPFKVIEMIMHDDFGKFDIQVVNALASGVVQFGIGSTIKLSNGYNGEVVFMNTRYPTRPIVRIEENNQMIYLEKERDLFIVEAL